MWRPFLTSSCVSTSCVSRAVTNGFSVFTWEYFKAQATNGKRNQKDTQIVAQEWRSLPTKEKRQYTRMAKAWTKKHSANRRSVFNMLLMMFAQQPEFNGMCHESFIRKLAKSTAENLTPKQEAKLRAKFDIQTGDPSDEILLPLSLIRSRGPFKAKLQIFTMPSMKYFTSFTDMQNSIAPTRKSAFVYSKASRTKKLSAFLLAKLEKAYEELPVEEKMKYRPITEEERLLFETFCFKNCVGMNAESFDILNLFCLFRGLGGYAVVGGELHKLHKSIASSDHAKDALFFKAYRVLSKVNAGRSSDYGMFITRHREERVIPSSAYQLCAASDEVTVAKAIVLSRTNGSIYDTVLDTARCLRAEANETMLSVYSIKDTIAAANRDAVRVTVLPAEQTPVNDTVDAAAAVEEEIKEAEAEETLASTENNDESVVAVARVEKMDTAKTPRRSVVKEKRQRRDIVRHVVDEALAKADDPDDEILDELEESLVAAEESVPSPGQLSRTLLKGFAADEDTRKKTIRVVSGSLKPKQRADRRRGDSHPKNIEKSRKRKVKNADTHIVSNIRNQLSGFL